MKLVRSFTLDSTLAGDIFCLENSPQVFLMQKDHVQFEIFLSSAKYNPGFSHVCISCDQRDELIDNALRHSYRVFRRKREHGDLLMARDNTTFSTRLHYTLYQYITSIMYNRTIQLQFFQYKLRCQTGQSVAIEKVRQIEIQTSPVAACFWSPCSHTPLNPVCCIS